jgi:hypothetical protein
VDAKNQLEILNRLVEVSVEEQDFLKVCETLTRIGVSSSKENTLYQSCHILHKTGRYWILHFKHLLQLDDLEVDISEQDTERYFTICKLLAQWGLVVVLYPDRLYGNINLKLIKIVPYKDKLDWLFVPKFTINKR